MIINNSYFYPDALLSVDELSKISGISKSTLYKNVSESKRDKTKLLFPYIKLSLYPKVDSHLIMVYDLLMCF